MDRDDDSTGSTRDGGVEQGKDSSPWFAPAVLSILENSSSSSAYDRLVVFLDTISDTQQWTSLTNSTGNCLLRCQLRSPLGPIPV
jgi:hypothetical protein